MIVGATSAIATHCARLWVQASAIDLTLVGRDIARLERVAADLSARSPQSEVRVLQSDFMEPRVIQTTVNEIVATGVVDVVLIAHGSLSDQSECQTDLMACKLELETNGISPVLFAEAFAKHMATSDHGTLAVIGSVAGDRGRQSNYIYGAAKGMVARYVQGLQHRFAGTQVKVILIKPGPTDTPMTAELKSQGVKLTPVEDVSEAIVAAIDRGQPVAYVPGKWWLIMMVIRHLPAFIFNKLNI